LLVLIVAFISHVLLEYSILHQAELHVIGTAITHNIVFDDWLCNYRRQCVSGYRTCNRLGWSFGRSNLYAAA
jgi:hypothetical protein